MRRGGFHTLERGGKSLLSSSDAAAEEHATAGGGGVLAGALAQQQRSALVALACPDLPPSALSGRLHLQAQQRARSALGCHERACASGYRPHLRAAATARAVLAVDAGLARDEAAERAEAAALDGCHAEDQLWSELLQAAKAHIRSSNEYMTACSARGRKERDRSEAVAFHLEAVAATLLRLAHRLQDIDSRLVANNLLQRSPVDAFEADARCQATAFVGVQVPSLEGVAVPAWLQWAEVVPTVLPARAALLLHCHVMVARPLVDEQYRDLTRTRTAAQAAAEGHVLGQTSGGRSRDGHLATAAALADALWRYWHAPPAAAAAAAAAAEAQDSCEAGGGRGERDGGGALVAGGSAAADGVVSHRAPQQQAQQQPLLLPPDMTVLAVVVSCYQALVLPKSDVYGGASGPLAVMTRPAVLMHVARMLNAELVARVPSTEAQSLLFHTLRRHLYECMHAALNTVMTAAAMGAEAAAGAHNEAAVMAVAGKSPPAAAKAQAAATSAAGASVEQLLGLLRQRYEVELQHCRQSAEQLRKDTVAAAAAAEAPGAPAERYEKVVEQAMARRSVLRAEVALLVWQRLTPALFQQAPRTAEQQHATSSVGAAAGAPPPPSGSRRQQQQQLQQQNKAAVLMLPDPLKQQVGRAAAGTPGRKGMDFKLHRAAFRWAAQESANRQAVARAMVGALAPCWEAAGAAAMTSEADATTAPPPQPGCSPHSPSPSSLVLQGAPAICYSLARTAAVNYVLDRVARGLAAAAVAAESWTPTLVTPPPPPPADDDAAELAALATRNMAAVAKGSRVVTFDGPTAARYMAAADHMRTGLATWHQACGWPLAMALTPGGGGGEAAAGGVAEPQGPPVRVLLEELLEQQMQGQGASGVDAASLMRTCVTATWFTQPTTGPTAPQPRQQATAAVSEAEELPSPEPGPGAVPRRSEPADVTADAMDPAAADTAANGGAAGEKEAVPSGVGGGGGHGGGCNPLQVTVAQRLAKARLLPADDLTASERDSSPGTAAHALVKQLRSGLQRSHLRALNLGPGSDGQLVVMALALAEASRTGQVQPSGAANDAAGRAAAAAATAAPQQQQQRQLVVVPHLHPTVFEAIAPRASDLLNNIVVQVLCDLTYLPVECGCANCVKQRSQHQTQEQAQESLAGQQGDPDAATAAELEATADAAARGGGALAAADSRHRTQMIAPDCVLRLPLTLSRAVCRLAGVSRDIIGWGLANLLEPPPPIECMQQQQPQPQPQQPQQPQQRPNEAADTVGSGEGSKASGAPDGMGAGMELLFGALCMHNASVDLHARLHKAGDATAAELAAASARVLSLREFHDALELLTDASFADRRADEAGEYDDDEADESCSDPLQALVPRSDEETEFEALLGYGPVRRPPPPLQLLVAEAAHGRPTELLEGCADASGM
ncbi:hypothetical protein HYH02_006745 [Chlamydomonas schloesseri]|uniref:Uncharacterized protein n=1 Tax=Chlamydomonas schloesseri TaxID=2026947 RepID=A0A836B5I7_9CHLO|nr:hypothetical protein HYH02_006745 [Chlamydomonas schloesseri]|eukprot:KAG2448160.1 hypothetical protein HYH02_006745 [Chlamydomonas schloesseri]